MPELDEAEGRRSMGRLDMLGSWDRRGDGPPLAYDCMAAMSASLSRRLARRFRFSWLILARPFRFWGSPPSGDSLSVAVKLESAGERGERGERGDVGDSSWPDRV